MLSLFNNLFFITLTLRANNFLECQNKTVKGSVDSLARDIDLQENTYF